jgi:plasmid stabilization system protein ParE
MNRYVLTTEAQQDLQEIRNYLLSEAGVRVTRRVLASIIAVFRSLVRTPGQGHRRQDLTSREELRFWPVFSYLVVYRIDRTPLTIIAVLHGRRQIQRILENR